MTLDDVMAAAEEYVDFCCTDNCVKNAANLRAAVLGYGRAERERAAVVCESHRAAMSVFASSREATAHNFAVSGCADRIRALPDEAAP